jgi:hypothetical protein
MPLHPPRATEILAGAFAALLILSLFLPWYRASDAASGCAPGQADCPRATATAFESFAVLDIVLLLVGIGGIALMVLEMTQETPAVPLAWAGLLTPAALVAFGLVVWRTLAPPGGEGDEPVFALLGLVASGGLLAATLLSMRSEGYGWRSRPGERRLPDPLPTPSVAGDGTGEERR